MSKYKCLVCGEDWGDLDPVDSFEICPSCGIQYAYDDAAGGDIELRQKIYGEWRRVWEENDKKRLSKDQIKALHQSTHPL